MGIVEDAFFSDNVNDVFAMIAKRTVYNYEELQGIMNRKTLVILFRYIVCQNEVSSKRLREIGIKGNIQSIRQINNTQYQQIRNNEI